MTTESEGVTLIPIPVGYFEHLVYEKRRLEELTEELVERAEAMTEAATTDHLCLDQIAAVLDGREWQAEDLETIALLVKNTGRSISEPTA